MLLMNDLETTLEADDGVVELARVLEHLDFAYVALPPGPRRWAPVDVAVETADDRLQVVRMTYRTVGDRVVVVAGARAGSDVDDLAERISTPLLYAHVRSARSGLPPAAILAALRGHAVWEGAGTDGWRLGQCGVGHRPVRLGRRHLPDAELVVATHGVAREELCTIIAGLEPLEPGSELAADLGARHRQALAQRWWDAPRAPWTADERSDLVERG